MLSGYGLRTFRTSGNSPVDLVVFLEQPVGDNATLVPCGCETQKLGAVNIYYAIRS